MSLVALGALALMVVHDVGCALRRHMATSSDTTMRFREEKSSIGPVRPGEPVRGVTLVGALLGALCMALVVPANALDAPRPSNGKPSLAKGLPMPPANSAKPRVLEWDDLIPLDQRDRPFPSPTRARPLFDDESGPPASQEGSSAVNVGLDEQWVKLPGFVVPLSVNGGCLRLRHGREQPEHTLATRRSLKHAAPML